MQALQSSQPILINGPADKIHGEPVHMQVQSKLVTEPVTNVGAVRTLITKETRLNCETQSYKILHCTLHFGAAMKNLTKKDYIGDDIKVGLFGL